MSCKIKLKSSEEIQLILQKWESMKNNQKKYHQSTKGQLARARANKKYYQKKQLLKYKVTA